MKTLKKSHVLSFTAVLAAVLVVGGSGIIGLFSLNQTRLLTQRNIEHIDLARTAQIELEKQYNSWKSAIYESDRFDSYRENFLEYSRHLAKAQDCIFNLTLVFRQNRDIYPRLNELKEYHNSLNSRFVNIISSLETTGKAERENAVAAMGVNDRKVISMMEDIVTEIKKETEREISGTNDLYFRIMLCSILLLLAGTGFMGMWIAYKNIRMHDVLSGQVEKRTAELSDANKQLRISEEKYRLLIEGSSDMIFSMSQDMQILRSNNASKKVFRIGSDKICGMNFLDFIYHESDRALERRFVKEKILALIEKGTPLHFNSMFKSPSNIEAKEYRVHLSIMQADGRREILGRIEDISEDLVFRYQRYEHSIYEIDNSLINAEDLAFRLTGALQHYIDSGEVSALRISLREMIINAIEHGNLGISFDEKTEAQARDGYYELVELRKNDPRYGNRRVKIEYLIDDRKVSYKITDEGSGFDTSKYDAGSAENANSLMLEHGRGIAMTRNAFDVVLYNEKGNQVLLVKNLIHVKE
jgi:PAS domain S-box-containing protein